MLLPQGVHYDVKIVESTDPNDPRPAIVFEEGSAPPRSPVPVAYTCNVCGDVFNWTEGGYDPAFQFVMTSTGERYFITCSGKCRQNAEPHLNDFVHRVKGKMPGGKSGEKDYD